MRIFLVLKHLHLNRNSKAFEMSTLRKLLLNDTDCARSVIISTIEVIIAAAKNDYASLVDI